MENAIIMKTVFTALTLGSKHFVFDKGQYKLPLLMGKKIYETYISGYHIFKNPSIENALRVGEVLDALVQEQPKDKHASVMLCYKGVPVGFLPMYEMERIIGKLSKQEEIKVKILEVNPKKPSWEQLKIEVFKCNK